MKKKAKKASAKANKPARASGAGQRSAVGVTPLNDKVLVRPLSPEEAEGAMTSFGIIIPETVSKEKPEQGTVVAVGPGRLSERGERIPLEVRVGDKVFFKKPWDEPMKIKGVEYYVISESEITLISN